MSKKVIIVITLILAICFFLLGITFKFAADQQTGISVSTGAVINGQFVTTSSGEVGANQEKYEMFNNAGTAFYVLASFTGIICVVTLIIDKTSKLNK